MSRVKHNATHQFSAGLNNAQTTGPASLPFALPGLQGWKVVTENFATGDDLTQTATPWVETVETSGTSTVGVNGPILTTNSSDNSSALLQHEIATMMPGASTKKFYLETSFTMTAATPAQNEMFIGVTPQVTGTNFIGSSGVAWTWDDGIGFGRLDADTEISFLSIKGTVEQSIGLGFNFVSGTKLVLACYYDGTNFNFYKDGAFVKSSAKETINDDTPVGVSIYCKAGTGEAQTMTVNYITYATEL